MERIYFEKQIFSGLYKGTDPLYIELLSQLKDNKHNFLYPYSHALLLDLKNDKSDVKYKELAFIETLIGDNYLAYDSNKKRTVAHLKKPLDAFNEIENEPEITFSDISDFFKNIDLSYATDEQKEQMTKGVDLLFNQKIDFGFSKLKDLPDSISNPVRFILPIENASMTFMEWIESFMGSLELMKTDKKSYKGLRNLIDSQVNNGKFTVDYNNIDFNDNLKNSVLQKSFIDIVNSNLNPNGDKEISDYDFFVNAYFSLDLLGISKEPSNKVKFNNVLNDGFHSYYGAHCDYVVSADLGFLRKTRAIYRLLNIDTIVLHVNDFIPLFKKLSDNVKIKTTTFIDRIHSDVTYGLYLNVQANKFDFIIEPRKTHFLHLGYFNKLESVSKNKRLSVCFSRSTQNYSDSITYREFEGIVNTAVRIFGADNKFKGEYSWENENKELDNDTWKGRVWKGSSMSWSLELNKKTGNLNLIVTYGALTLKEKIVKRWYRYRMHIAKFFKEIKLNTIR